MKYESKSSSCIHSNTHLSSRRQLLQAALAVGAGTVGLTADPKKVFAAKPGPSPYGSIGQQDNSGVLLPRGFRARVIARSGQRVPGTSFTWRGNPDGAATFADRDGGWFHAVNHEIRSGGGVSVIHYRPDGGIRNAYSVLSSTRRNCAGGPTPWGTWLSCEEVGDGRVYECDPRRPGQGSIRPALGSFNHEAVAVDPARGHLYLTEDRGDGLLYRFRPNRYPNLSSGVLEAARMSSSGQVSWVRIPDPDARTKETRFQVSGVTRFKGGEGIWYHGGRVWFTTKGDDGVWEFNLGANRITRIWNGGQPLTGVDNITVAGRSGDIYVAEDGGNMEVVIISTEGNVAPFLRVRGQSRSEITGPVFNPAGNRMYFSSQRGSDGNGITYEVVGPFRRVRRQAMPETRYRGTFALQNLRHGTYLSGSATNRIEIAKNIGPMAIWDVVDIGDTGRVYFINQATGRRLDGGGADARPSNSTSAGRDDEWELDDFATDVFTIRNISAKRYVEAKHDGFVRLHHDQATDAQWRFVPIEPAKDRIYSD